MGRLAKLLSFIRVTRNSAKLSDVKVDPGGGANITGEHFASPGDDSHPLPGDYVALNERSGTGREDIIGYIDSINEPKAQPGDKRIYARDENTSNQVNEVWLKNDGSVLVSNDNGSVLIKADGSIKGDNGSGSFELEASGNFVVNGVIIDTSGNITTTGTIAGATLSASSSLTVAGKEMSGHTHSQANDSNGDTQQNTSAPL